jgi:ATP-binding cassette, sub-family E, member 1
VCSYKPQKISPKFQGTVRQLLHKKIRDAYVHPQFVSDVMKPMSMDGYIHILPPLLLLLSLSSLYIAIILSTIRLMTSLLLNSIIDNGVQNLSGGELQRVAIVMALGTPADIYLV